jgi:GGDEF domain-containing protein
VERPIVVEGKAMIMTASLGVAIYPDDAHDSVRLLRVADQRMYARKHRPPVAAPKGVVALTTSAVDATIAVIASGQN